MKRSGPLVGIRVLEIGGIGPGPFCGMLLADFGADVLRLDRPGPNFFEQGVHARGKRSIAIDLKSEQDLALTVNLIEKADVLIEGYRPGVMEKLGLGPEVVLGRNPRLIYGRMTGWGQDGPLAQAAGHDINYIALAGALASIGPGDGPPVPPLNLLGDFGGGSLYLAIGILSALVERSVSGKGQVVDAAMIDGVASLMSGFSSTIMSARRGENFLGGSAHYYRCYECSDGRFISIGCVEPKFYDLLWEKLGAAAPGAPPGQSPKEWGAGAEVLASIFKTKRRDQWCALLEGTDVCFAPVMEYEEAPSHPHMKARGVFVEAFGVVQPGPVPRLSRTPGKIHGPPVEVGADGGALMDWGIARARQRRDAAGAGGRDRIGGRLSGASRRGRSRVRRRSSGPSHR